MTRFGITWIAALCLASCIDAPPAPAVGVSVEAVANGSCATFDQDQPDLWCNDDEGFDTSWCCTYICEGCHMTLPDPPDNNPPPPPPPPPPPHTGGPGPTGPDNRT